MEEQARVLPPQLIRYTQLLQRFPLGSDFWVGFPARMRFKIGGSPREFRVPFGFTLDVEDVVTRAIADLTSLLGQRARAQAAKRKTLRGRELTLEVDVAEVREASERVTARPRSFALRTFKAGSVQVRVARECVGSDPMLDTGVLDVWFFRGGAGSELAETFMQLYEKAIEQEVRLESPEPLTYLTHLALLHLCMRKMEMLKRASSKSLSYEALDRAVSIVLAATLRESVATVITDFEMRGLPRDLVAIELATTLSATPLVLMSSARTVQGTIDLNPVLRAIPNPYELSKSIVDQLDEAYHVVGDDAPDVPGKIEALVRYANDDMKLLGQLADVGDMIRLRQRTLAYLARHDSAQDLRNLDLSDVVTSHLTTTTLARDQEGLQRAVDACVQLSRGASEKVLAQLGDIQAGLRRYLKKGYRRSSGSLDIPGAVETTIQRYMLARLDTMVDHHLSSAFQFLVDRGQEWNDQEFVDEYEAGRVYRIARDVRPMRRERIERSEAHLFLDMKGFTKRTVVDRALNVADFMKQHFFGPILQQAHKYRDRDGRPLLRLNNLLGDAISFSGDIVSLLALVDDLEKIFGDYESKLSARDVGGAEHEARQELEAEYQAMKNILTRALGELDDQLAPTATRATAEPPSAAEAELIAQRDAVAQRLKQLEAYYEERRRRLEDSRIEVGLFVSYGTAVEVVRIEDDVFGSQNVAVAEKINEAARGTARNEAVRAKLDHLLGVEQSGRPGVQLPFDVYVERAFRVVLPDELSLALARGVAGHTDGESVAAQIAARLEREIGRAGVTDHGEARMLRPHNDIYNVGRALSKEALEAFLRATATTRVAIKRRLDVLALHPSLQKAFWFERDTIDLVLSIPLAKGPVYVFRFAGELTFRGFEASHSTSIYEMLKPRSLFHQGVMRYHMPAWRQQLKDGKIPIITSL